MDITFELRYSRDEGYIAKRSMEMKEKRAAMSGLVAFACLVALSSCVGVITVSPAKKDTKVIGHKTVPNQGITVNEQQPQVANNGRTTVQSNGPAKKAVVKNDRVRITGTLASYGSKTNPKWIVRGADGHIYLINESYSNSISRLRPGNYVWEGKLLPARARTSDMPAHSGVLTELTWTPTN
jgi:hypothetical protein